MKQEGHPEEEVSGDTEHLHVQPTKAPTISPLIPPPKVIRDSDQVIVLCLSCFDAFLNH